MPRLPRTVIGQGDLVVVEVTPGRLVVPRNFDGVAVALKVMAFELSSVWLLQQARVNAVGGNGHPH